MQLTKLYGRGAIVMNDDRRNYQMMNGVIELPTHLVARGLAMGLTRHPLPSIAPEPEAIIAPAAVAAIAAPVKAPVKPPVAGVVTVDALGRWSVIAEGPDGTRSFRYAYDKGEAPPADLVAVAGIILSEATFLAEGGDDERLDANERIHFTIVPFDGPDGSGNAGDAIELSGGIVVPATASASLPGEHPQVAASAAAAARAHESSHMKQVKPEPAGTAASSGS